MALLVEILNASFLNKAYEVLRQVFDNMPNYVFDDSFCLFPIRFHAKSLAKTLKTIAKWVALKIKVLTAAFRGKI